MANPNHYALEKPKAKALDDFTKKVSPEPKKPNIKEKPSMLQLPSEGLLTSNLVQNFDQMAHLNSSESHN